MKNNFAKNNLMIFIIILFFLSSQTAAAIGQSVKISGEEIIAEDCNYACYHRSEISNPEQYDVYRGLSIYDTIVAKEIVNQKQVFQPLDAPMNSSWPMYCHDVRHTGRSPYSTVDTCDEIWKFETRGWAQGGPVIDEDKIIYIGAYRLYAVYPDGTLKWEYKPSGNIMSCPTIDDNGVIYFGTTYGTDYLYALYSNGTLKWKYNPNSDIFSSPVIDDDVIYFGSGGDYPPTGRVNALYLNGTLKWKFDTNHVVYSSPTIGDNGTVYCGSHDTYLYALYPNNGTLKWKYKTGNWIRTSPCIGDDGTIYIVSLDGSLHAVNPDGSFKWSTYVGAGTSPTIGWDGTIYCGYTKLHAVNPVNGSVKWTFDVGGTIRGGTPCNSIDGTIYVGTSDGGEIIAINSDGTLKWRKRIGTVESPPAIDEDGGVYVGSCQTPGEGFLHAFGIGDLQADSKGPYYGLVDVPVQFTGYSKGGYSPHSYHWIFGDGESSDEQNPTYIYTSAENYTVTFIVTDNTGNTSEDTTWVWVQDGNTPPNKPTITGPTSGKEGTSYDYTFTPTDSDESNIYIYIEWGDDTNNGWIGPYNSGEEITLSHSWSQKGTYTIRCKAKDPYDVEGEWSEFEVSIPRSKVAYNSVIQRFLDVFPLLERFLFFIGFNI